MGSCAAPSAKGDDKFITTDYLQQCPPDEFNWLIAGVDWQQVKGHDLTKWGWQNEPELRPENTQNTLLTQ